MKMIRINSLNKSEVIAAKAVSKYSDLPLAKENLGLIYLVLTEEGKLFPKEAGRYLSTGKGWIKV